jgi:NTP pyrophosphatase (non-canonical NTP hydrolase)
MQKTDNTATLQDLKKEAALFTEERDWQKFHSPQALAMNITIEAAELLELFIWKDHQKIQDLLIKDKAFKKNIEDELGDILLSCLCFANTLNIDMTTTFLDKLQRTKLKYPAEQWKGIATKK